MVRCIFVVCESPVRVVVGDSVCLLWASHLHLSNTGYQQVRAGRLLLHMCPFSSDSQLIYQYSTFDPKENRRGDHAPRTNAGLGPHCMPPFPGNEFIPRIQVGAMTSVLRVTRFMKNRYWEYGCVPYACRRRLYHTRMYVHIILHMIPRIA